MNKLIKCNASHENMLLTYLEQEAVRNTFLIGDILNYGFENEIQNIWADISGEECSAIYLWFCNNLLIYSHVDSLNSDSITQIIHMKKPDQVMAKRIHLEQVSSLLDGYTIKSKSLLAYNLDYNNNRIATSTSFPYTKGTLDDVDAIYNFLQSGELAPLYRSKEMIESRIKTGEGTHLYITENTQLISHINSAASTPYSTMIGGLFTKDKYRNQGMATYLLTCLCQEIINNNRIPCLITAQAQKHNLFYNIGFKEVEEFTTLEPA